MYSPKNKIKIYYPKYSKNLTDKYEIYVKNEIHRKNKIEITYISINNDLMIDYSDFDLLIKSDEYTIYQLPLIFIKDLLLLVDNTRYFTFSEISFKKSFIKISNSNKNIFYIHIWFIINGIQYHFNIKSKINFDNQNERKSNGELLFKFFNKKQILGNEF